MNREDVTCFGRVVVCLVAALAGARAAEKVTFVDHVAQILRDQCAGCHNQDDAASGFAADSFDALLVGGAGGEVVAPGDPDASRLWRLVTHSEQPAMPPGDKLPDSELAVIKAWIEGGLLKDAGSKPMERRGPVIAAVAKSETGRPIGDPAMPKDWFRQPAITARLVGPVNALAASRWAPLVAVAWQRQASIYHAETGELLGVAPYLDGAARVVRFSRDGSLLLVAGGRDAALGAAAIYDVITGARIATVGDELDTVLAADISADNALVAIGGPKKKVRVFRLSDGQLAYTLAKHTDWITALEFSPDGKLIATADRAAGLRLWQAAAGHERGDLRGHKGAIHRVAWRTDGGLLASASEDGSVRLWAPDGAEVKAIKAHGRGVMSVAFAADGRLVTAGRDHRVKLWKPDGAPLADLPKTDDVALAAVFTRDANRVAVSDWTGAVRLIDLESKRAVADLAPNPPSLAERVGTAESGLATAEETRRAADAAVETALAALEAGRQRHAEYDARLADARLAETDAGAVLAEAEQTHAQREETFAATRGALEAVSATLSAAESRFERSKGTDDPLLDLGALAAEVEAARSAKQSAAAAHSQAAGLRGESARSVEAARQRLETAETFVAQIANQSAGLPDLDNLETGVKKRRRHAKQRAQQVAEAIAARDAAVAERDRYAQAVERLAAGQAEAAAKHEALAAAADDVAQDLQHAADAYSAAQAELKALQKELKELRAKLGQQKLVASQAQEALDHAKANAAERQAARDAAQRDALLREARVETLRRLEAFRAKRAAE